jgi:DnaJ-class molecular chaperone
MTTQICPDCDVPGEGNCRGCHGTGKIPSDKSFGEFHAAVVCPRCKGSGNCQTCGGLGEIEAGGESG